MSGSFHPARNLRLRLVAPVLATICTLTMTVLVPTALSASTVSGPATALAGARYPYPAKCPIGTPNLRKTPFTFFPV